MRVRVFLALLVALPTLLVTGQASAKYKNFDCKLTNGPEYTYKVPGKTSRWRADSYFVSGFGTTCTFAKKWVRVLAKKPYRGNKKTLTGGPPGWKCKSGNLPESLDPLTVFIGNCQNKKNLSRVFDWTDATGPNDGPVDPPKAPDPPPDQPPSDEPVP